MCGQARQNGQFYFFARYCRIGGNEYEEKKAKRFICLLFAVVLSFSSLPFSAMAADASDNSLSVFDALGFETGTPLGYNENEDVTDTPYGKTYTTTMDVRELTLGEHLTAYDANGNVISELDAIVGDTEITVKAAPGYSVTDDAAWTINDTPLETQPTNGEYTFVLTEDTTVKANVAANSYTVAVAQGQNGTASFDATVDDEGKTLGGSEVKFDTQADGLKVDTQIILSGTSVTQPTAPTRAGYTFGGWYTSADCKDSDLYNFADAVNDDLTLYAKWTKLLDSDDTPSGDSGNTPSDDNGAESVGIDDESETGRESSATDADDTEDVKKTESENRNTDTKSPLTGEITGTSVWISMLLAVAVVIVIAHLYDRRWKVAQK